MIHSDDSHDEVAHDKYSWLLRSDQLLGDIDPTICGTFFLGKLNERLDMWPWFSIYVGPPTRVPRVPGTYYDVTTCKKWYNDGRISFVMRIISR